MILDLLRSLACSIIVLIEHIFIIYVVLLLYVNNKNSQALIYSITFNIKLNKKDVCTL